VRRPRPIDGSPPLLLRPLRLIFLLLAVAATLVVALVRPLPSRAGTSAAAADTHKRKPRPKWGLMVRSPEPRHLFGRRVVRYARHFLGVRYSWGGTSPHTGFDCSGLVRYVFGHFGISLPHSSFADLWQGRRVSRRHLRPGDLVFFGDASHVGIYVGADRFIDAPHSGTVVRISTMAGSWYGATYDGARRLQATRRR
jgi:cell wall-associated NlpC family hydrolase